MKRETSIVGVVIWCEDTSEITFTVSKGDRQAEAKTYLSLLKPSLQALLLGVQLNRVIF